MDTELRLLLLFSKFLERQCTPQEMEEMEGLLQQTDAENVLAGPMQAIWREIRDDRTKLPVSRDRMYEREKKHIWKILQKIFVAFIGLLIVSIGYWAISGNPGRPVQHRPMASGGNILNQLSLNTGKGGTIHLPDGSTVILNAGSQLSYPAAFAGNVREVYLTGEGYFNIVHYPGQPFLVHAGKITTLVLGTGFDVKAYPGDESIEVTVTHGKVQVLRENKSMGLLTANQQFSFSKKTKVYAQKQVNAAAIIAWAPGQRRAR